MTEEGKGDCFPAAFRHLLTIGAADPNGKAFVLVHGNLAHLPQDEEFNHAWVEEGDMVHEVANGQNRRIPKDEYYSALNVTKTRRYSAIEALARGIEHQGPWDD